MVRSAGNEVARDINVEPIELISTGAALGAELRGLDLRNLDASQFATIERAWHDHQVILVRAQTLDDQDLITFSRRFGDLDWAPIQENGRRFVEGMPEIYIVSNVKVNGEAIGSLGDGEAVWHTDMSYLDKPPKASMLYSLEIHERRQHLFLQHVRDLRGASCRAEGTYRRARDQARRHLQQRRLSAPGRHRDRRSPHLARRAASAGLHTPRQRPAHALSRPPPQRLYRRLLLATPRPCWTSCGAMWRPEFAWEHVWQVGDLVLWDNRCTMHRRDAFDPEQRRIMHRTQVKGDARPV